MDPGLTLDAGPPQCRTHAEIRLDADAYRCVGVAVRNRQNQLRPSIPIMTCFHPARAFHELPVLNGVGTRWRKRRWVPAAEPQMSNRKAKSDRVALLLNGPSYTDFDPSYLRPAITAPILNRQLGPSDTGILNDAQIAGIESRLRLTQRQASYWPAVAAALRDVGRRYFHRRTQRQNVGQKIDLKSPEVKRLIEAATPLIQTLSEVQKREVRQLVRIIGLETVASHI
jgi:hypothetical protein